MILLRLHLNDHFKWSSPTRMYKCIKYLKPRYLNECSAIMATSHCSTWMLYPSRINKEIKTVYSTNCLIMDSYTTSSFQWLQILHYSLMNVIGHSVIRRTHLDNSMVYYFLFCMIEMFSLMSTKSYFFISSLLN